MKRKWYKLAELGHKELVEMSEMHVWGPKMGMHIGYYNGKYVIQSDGEYFNGNITLVMPFPLPPRKRNM